MGRRRPGNESCSDVPPSLPLFLSLPLSLLPSLLASLLTSLLASLLTSLFPFLPPSSLLFPPSLPSSLPPSLPLPSLPPSPPSPSSLSLSFFPFLCSSPPSLSSPILYIQGNLSQPGMFLEGQVDRGRFGNSVTNLGDIDDDGNEGMHVCRI